MIALRRKSRIEDLAGDVVCSATSSQARRFYHPPKDVDQEVGKKLEGSIEKSESGS